MRKVVLNATCHVITMTYPDVSVVLVLCHIDGCSLLLNLHFTHHLDSLFFCLIMTANYLY